MSKNFLAWMLLIICLAPISITSATNEGISANYLFLLIIPLLVRFRFRENMEASLFVSIFSACFFISIPFNYLILDLGPDQFLRQMISVVVFLVPFVLLYLNLENMEDIFINAIIAISFAYSIFSLLYFFQHINSHGLNPFVIKALLGEYLPDWPQRFVLVLFAGFYFSYERKFKSFGIYIVRITILCVILITFLRAAFLALSIGFLVFWFLDDENHKSLGSSLKKFGYGLAFLFIATLLFTVFRYTDFIDSYVTIFQYFTDSADSLLSGRGADNVSDKLRLDLLVAGLTRINPIVGLGGGSIYFITPEVGSAHIQFLDYYVRFGLPGIVSFLYFNFRIIKFNYKTRPWLIGLFLTFLVFGVAHETTKYSYGSLIFFYYLSLTYGQKIKLKSSPQGLGNTSCSI